MNRRAAVLVTAAAAALVAASAASAHAFLLRTAPAAGQTVRVAPTQVLLVFDEPVSPAKIEITHADGAPVRAGKPFSPKGHATQIAIPLGHGLGRGGYVVEWSEVDEDDGHRISGRFSFAVGAGVSAPAVSATSGSDFRAGDAVARWLLIAGILVAAGLVLFRRLVWRRRERDTGFVATGAGALLAAAAGATALLALQPGFADTQFDRVVLAGAIEAGALALLTVVAIRFRPLRVATDVGALVLLAVPTFAGHAVARGPAHWLSVPSDLLHVLAAAVWVGGVVALVFVVPRGSAREATRRFAPIAAAAVVALALTGVLRAAGELKAVSQLWSTSYGTTLLVKTALFAAIVVSALLARRRPGRRSLAAEAAVMCLLVAAVAVLTGLRPGRDVRAAIAAPAAPAVVTAGEAGTYAVGVALSQSGSSIRARATVLGQDGPANGLAVTVRLSGRELAAAPCGAGCYEALVPVRRPGSLSVALERDGHGVGTATLRVPQRWPAPSAAAIVRRATRVFRSLDSLSFSSRLAYSPTHAIITDWRVQAPDRVEGIQRGSGSGAVIIGARRWDRDSARARWVRSPQAPVRQPSAPWPPRFRDAHVLGSVVVHGRAVWRVSFLDPVTPAWFTADVDKRTGRTYAMDMVALAHFMHEEYTAFNSTRPIEPPR